MKSKDLVKAIRAAKGPIYVAVQSIHDTYYIQAVKSDLITVFSFNNPSDETFMAIESKHGAHYIDKDYSV